jgi:integrase
MTRRLGRFGPRRLSSVSIRQNPVSKIRRPARGKASKRRATVEDFERLRIALAKRRNGFLSNIIVFAIHAGMRRGEILSIRWSDINFDATMANLADARNGEPPTVPSSSSALAALTATENRAADERVFPLSPNAVRLAWRRFKHRAGINDLHFHDPRHEAISRSLELSLWIPEVAPVGGHRDFEVTRFVHQTGQEQHQESRAEARSRQGHEVGDRPFVDDRASGDARKGGSGDEDLGQQ